MTTRIYSGAEAMVLRTLATPGPWRCESTGEFRGEIVTPTCDVVAHVERAHSEDAVLLAAAPDLAASVAHHAAETRREQGRVSGLVLLLDGEKAKRVAAEQECARLRARVAELEALATGPRSLAIDDAACAAIDGAGIAPRDVDANGSHTGGAL